jgi:GDPmannose 4,6-dehydratase
MTTRRALVTGITGQDGSYLAELLLDKGYDVVGLVRRSSTVTFERIAHIQGRLTIESGDLLDQGSLIAALSTHRPHEVYNLAAQSYVAASFAQPVLTGDVTALGVTRLLEAVRIVDPDIRLYQASSSEMFGNAATTPQHETTPVAPRSPYGAAKAYAHFTAVNYRERYGMHVSCGIAFNHESPRRGQEFLTRKVARGVAAIKTGQHDRLELGSLTARRDWGFAGDYVEAMWAMLQRDDPDDYVIATGQTHSIEELVASAFAHVGLTWTDHVVHDERLTRPTDIELLTGDATKARTALGWTPHTSFEQLVAMMVDHDLAEHQGTSTPGAPTPGG